MTLVEVNKLKQTREWPDPTPAMLDNDPLFDAIWNTIKSWDINVPALFMTLCAALAHSVWVDPSLKC